MKNCHQHSLKSLFQDGDGLVTPSEFIPLYMRATSSQDDDRALFLFFRVDKDESGSVNSAEVESLFGTIDANGKHIHISIDELHTWFGHNRMDIESYLLCDKFRYVCGLITLNVT